MWFAIQIVVAIFAILWVIGAFMVMWDNTRPPKKIEIPDPRLVVTNPDGSQQELQLLYSGRNIDELV
jgi:hypothetical protein